MVQITIDDNLAQAIALAGKFVTLVDSRGNEVARLTTTEPKAATPLGMTPEHLAEIERRMKEDDGKRYTWAEVMQRLRALEQVDSDVSLAWGRMEDAKRGGTFYTTKVVLEHLHAPD
jgi:hypothetical protein